MSPRPGCEAGSEESNKRGSPNPLCLLHFPRRYPVVPLYRAIERRHPLRRRNPSSNSALSTVLLDSRSGTEALRSRHASTRRDAASSHHHLNIAAPGLSPSASLHGQHPKLGVRDARRLVRQHLVRAWASCAAAHRLGSPRAETSLWSSLVSGHLALNHPRPHAPRAATFSYSLRCIDNVERADGTAIRSSTLTASPQSGKHSPHLRCHPQQHIARTHTLSPDVSSASLTPLPCRNDPVRRRSD